MSASVTRHLHGCEASVGVADRPRSRHPRRAGGDGSVEVFVSDEQSDIVVDVVRWQQLATKVLQSEGVRGQAEMALLFVATTTIQEMNRIHMGNDAPTDVLAFPIDLVDDSRATGPAARTATPVRARVDVGDLPLLVGDVVVCPQVAAGQAADHAGNLDDELALLVTHGVLHVLGYDHDTQEHADRMRARERELLEQLHWSAPAPTRFRQGY